MARLGIILLKIFGIIVLGIVAFIVGVNWNKG
jgi:hypothetical protein